MSTSASKKPEEEQGGAAVDPISMLASMPIQQLQMVKQQLEQEIQVLATSLAQLQAANGKFNHAKSALDDMHPKNENATAMIPLTNSLYVKGKVSNVKTVMVDVGTGYYVEKSVKDAMDFYTRKTSFIKSQLENLQNAILAKKHNLQALLDIMQHRVMQAQQAVSGDDAAKKLQTVS